MGFAVLAISRMGMRATGVVIEGYEVMAERKSAYLESHRVPSSAKGPIITPLFAHSHVSNNLLKSHPIPHNLWDEMGDDFIKPRRAHPDKVLTAAKVKKVSEAGRHADGNGLYLVVDPSGARRWVLRTAYTADVGI
jgi:hypothetical protein